MTTDSQKSKVQMKNNEDRGNREKKEEKLDISSSNQENAFLNFRRSYNIHHSWDFQKSCY